MSKTQFTQKKRLSRLEIRQAILTDGRFRNLFPELAADIAAVIKNPTCSCNIPIYDKFFRFKDRLASYFSQREIVPPEQETEEENQNNWNVINCHIDEIEESLNKLHKVGRYQVAIARYQDQATIVINELGIMF